MTQQHVTIVLGSYQSENMGKRVGLFLESACRNVRLDTALIDPMASKVPFLNSIYQAQKNPPQQLQEIHKIFATTDAFILVSGEYNHLPTPGLLNVINFFHKEYADKPCGLVTYSTGEYGGARALCALRTFTAALGFASVCYSLAIPKVAQQLDSLGHPQNHPQNHPLLRKRDIFLKNFMQQLTKLKEVNSSI